MNLTESSRAFLEREIPANRMELLPISLIHATFVEGLPLYHRDPFDRLLIAQAIVEDIPIIGADAAFDAYPGPADLVENRVGRQIGLTLARSIQAGDNLVVAPSTG